MALRTPKDLPRVYLFLISYRFDRYIFITVGDFQILVVLTYDIFEAFTLKATD